MMNSGEILMWACIATMQAIYDHGVRHIDVDDMLSHLTDEELKSLIQVNDFKKYWQPDWAEGISKSAQYNLEFRDYD